MASKYAIETIFKAIDNVTAPLKKMDSQMQKFGTASTYVNTALKDGVVSAEKAFTKLNGAIKKVALTAGTAAAGAVSAFAVNGIKNAIEYEQSLAKLSTIASDLPMDKASKDILAVSTTMHVAAEEITESTYNAISSGIEASKAVDFVATATKAAKAGFAETGVAIDGLTNVMNAYGMSADNAMKIADQMLVTQNLGKATFTDMAKGMGQIAPIASSLNVRTEELFASIAALTNAGIQTPQAITGMKAALSNIMKPTKQASDLAEQLGLDFSASGLQAKGWVGFLEEIKTATKGDAAMMATLFGSVEALNSVSVLTGKGAAKLTESLDAMSTMAGITEKSFNRMMQTPAERMAGMKNQFKNAGIKLGESLLPIFEKLADKAESLVNWIDKNIDAISAFIQGATDSIAGLIQTIWNLRKPILAIAGTYATINVIIAGIKAWNAITEIAQGIQMAYAIVVKGSEAATAALAFATDGVAKATKIFSAIMSGVGWAGSAAKAVAYKASLLASSVATKAATAAQYAWNTALTAGRWVKATAAIIAQKVATLAMAAAQGVATAATSALSTATGILNALFVASPIGWIVLAIGALIAVIILCVKHWDSITAAVGAAWEKIKAFAAFIQDKLSAAFSFLGGLLAKAAETIKGVFLSAIDNVRRPIQQIFDAFTDGGIIGGLRQIGASILKFMLTPILNTMGVLSKIPGIGGKIGDAKEWLEGKIASLDYAPDDSENKERPQTAAPKAFTTPYTVQATRHTETNRSEMQISLDRGLNAQVYGKAPGITVQTQKTGTFD